MTWALLLFGIIYTFILFSGKQSNQLSDYLNAGRKYGVFPLIATLCVSQYGWINGVFEVYCAQGPMAWLILSLPYLGFNLIWVWMSKYLHSTNSSTTPALFLKQYDKKTQVLAALFLSVIFLPVMYIHMGSNVLVYATGISLQNACLIFLALTIIPVFTGGFQKLVKADLFLFGITYFVLFLTAFYSFQNMPTGEVSVTAYAKTDFGSYLNWWLMALIVFIDPSIHQRLWAGKTKKHAQKVMGGAIAFWILFDLLIIAIVVWNPGSTSIYAIMDTLPHALQILLVLFLLAVILSTSNTYFNLVFNHLAFDMFGLKSNKFGGKFIGIAIALVLLCFYLVTQVYAQKSVIHILFDLFPSAIAALFIPFLGTVYNKLRIPANVVFVQMLLSAAVCLFLQINPLNWSNFATEIPVAAGLSTSLLLFIIVKYLWQQKETRS